MEELTINEIKSSELCSLKIFIDFCEKYNLQYYLAFGSLLGAVRHKGFIPWDDDIDILMPRKDYDFLIDNFNGFSKNDRQVISRKNCNNFYLEWAKIIDTSTLLIEKGSTMPIGVWVDVFPMDYATCKFKYKLLIRKIKRINYLICCSNINADKLVWYEIWKRPIIKYLLKKRDKNLIKKQDTFTKMISNKESKNFCFTYKWLYKYGYPILPVKLFVPGKKLEFEGITCCVPNNYDKFLRLCYGDYLKLPSKEKQKSKHSYICYRK